MDLQSCWLKHGQLSYSVWESLAAGWFRACFAWMWNALKRLKSLTCGPQLLRLWKLDEVELQWTKWVSWEESWDVLTQPHFLFTFYCLTANATGPSISFPCSSVFPTMMDCIHVSQGQLCPSRKRLHFRRLVTSDECENEFSLGPWTQDGGQKAMSLCSSHRMRWATC